jgi:hypothetical protein
MVEFNLGGFDLSAHTEPGKMTVTRKNIYEDISLEDSSGAEVFKVIGCYYEITANITALSEEIATALISSASGESLPVTFPIPGGGSNVLTKTFARPELTVTAIRERTDGDYYDITVKLRSENIYSDDCL